MQLDNVARVFERYQAVRHRLPHAAFPTESAQIDSLLEIAPHAEAFVFDAFGVLNIGDTPIEGAAERLEQLRAKGLAIRILSNAASYDHRAAVAKFRKLGIAIADEEVITSRDATLGHLGTTTWGCIAAPSDDLSDIGANVCRLEDDEEPYDRVGGILFLSGDNWSPQRQDMLQNALIRNPRPILIANADVVAPREHGFTLEPGHFGHLLADQGIDQVRFFGKPFPEVYSLVEATLPGISRQRIVMCGDTLHTDILGAAARGWRSVLVTRDGLFSGANALEYCRLGEFTPDWHLARI